MIKGLRSWLQKHSYHIVSRWVILLLDISVVFVSFVIAYLLRFNFVLSDIMADTLKAQILVYVFAFLVSFFVFQPFRGIIRHTSLVDALMIFYSATFSLILLTVFTIIIRSFFVGSLLNFSAGVLLISYMSSLFMLLFIRFSVKVFYMNLVRVPRSFENFLVFGAGEMGISTLQAIHSSQNGQLKVIGFIDDNPSKAGKVVYGIRVYSDKMLNSEFLEKKKVAALILAVNKLSSDRRAEIIERCLELNLEVRSVPKVEEWAMGRLSYGQIRKVQIEDLLEREPISVNSAELVAKIRGKVVLVTGAAGSIGSELSKQLDHLNPSVLLMLDSSETPLNDLELMFRSGKSFGVAQKFYLLNDVTNAASMRKVFERYRPDVVYHAAAYKHVPVMESNPLESIRVNVLGTRLVARLAQEFGVSKFVFVSTDKAVNPTSIMGASKRIGELLVQSIQAHPENRTSFIITRFGNVLGSKGSVVPLFTTQIASGGPVTVTHPDMVRYFMTIPEACELVLEASVMGAGGEIFVFDMGKQQKISDLAEKMIKLSGLRPGIDIDIVYTGLRPGEKLYEELFSIEEGNLPTHHPKIMIATLEKYPYDQLPGHIACLEAILESQQDELIRDAVKKIVPEFTGLVNATPKSRERL